MVQRVRRVQDLRFRAWGSEGLGFKGTEALGFGPGESEG